MGLEAALWQELVAGFPDSTEMARIVVRLIVAVVLDCLVRKEKAGTNAAQPVPTRLTNIWRSVTILLSDSISHKEPKHAARNQQIPSHP